MTPNTKTIAWNVDTQYDFMRPDGKLYVQGAEQIEPTLEKLTKLFAAKGTTVVNTADWHFADSQELSATPDYMTTFPEHCMAFTPGAAYVPATQPTDAYIIVDWRDETFSQEAVKANRNIILYKDAFNVFTGTKHADGILKTIDPERVIVYGVATNVCVDQAVTGLLTRGKDVYVVKDAIKELPNLPLEAVLNNWTKKGATLITADEVPAYLG